MEIEKQQKDICKKYSTYFFDSPSNSTIGVALNIKGGMQPINGLRHPPVGDTTGWYIWAGEYSESPDFFKPLHVEHLREWCPIILKYLGLPPGWRFLIAANYEDIWQDKSLLDINEE